MWQNPQFPADLDIFTEEILNGKLHSLCSVGIRKAIKQLYDQPKKGSYKKVFWKYAANLQENTHVEEHLWRAASGKAVYILN